MSYQINLRELSPWPNDRSVHELLLAIAERLERIAVEVKAGAKLKGEKYGRKISSNTGKS